MRTFFGLVGLGMFLGFGALFVTNWHQGEVVNGAVASSIAKYSMAT